MKVFEYTPDEWSSISEQAHSICFNEIRDPSLDRISFALLATDENQPTAYMTCKELDSETIYLQYGGSFPSVKGTCGSYRSYLAMLNHLMTMGYKRAGTYIENTNTPMLKFALKAGWIITGIRTFNGSVLLEHQLNFSKE